MGNFCCKRKPKKLNELILSRKLFNTEIRVVLGDITQDTSKCVVNWTDCFLLGESSIILSKAIDDDLRKELQVFRDENKILSVGEIVCTKGGKLPHAQTIIHSTLPLWRGGAQQELEALEIAITQCLKTAADRSIESIAFTQESSDSFGIPLQHASDVLLKVFYQYAMKNKGETTAEEVATAGTEQQQQQHPSSSQSLMTLTFVHSDASATGMFKKRLAALTEEGENNPQDENKSDAQSEYSDRMKQFYYSQGSEHNIDDLEGLDSSNQLVQKKK